jgi:hypothetical protein
MVLSTMLELAISSLAIACALCVGALCVIRWQRSSGYKSAVYLVVSVFAGLVALLNLSAMLASDASFVRTATLAYVGFATAILLPAARALGNLTYEKPKEEAEGKDAAV